MIQRETLELLFEHPEGIFQKDLNLNAIRKLIKMSYVKKGIETFSSGKKMIFITEEGKKALTTPLKCEILDPKFQYCSKEICVNHAKCHEIFTKNKIEFENKNKVEESKKPYGMTKMIVKPESPLYKFFNK